MQELNSIVNERFVDKLLDQMAAIGVARRTVQAIFIEGSALYLENPGDIDFKILVTWHNPKAEIGRSFEIDGYKVECTYYTLAEWNAVDQTARSFYFITEAPDMILVYGSDLGFKRFDVVSDKALARKVLDIYGKQLFNYQAPVRDNGRTMRNDADPLRLSSKRLWNFLLFAYKIQNGSHKLTAKQMQAVQNAHDGKTSVEDYRRLFAELDATL